MLKIEENMIYRLKELEAGGILKVPTLREWIKAGELRASRMGKAYFVLGSDLMDAIRRRRVPIPGGEEAGPGPR